MKRTKQNKTKKRTTTTKPQQNNENTTQNNNNNDNNEKTTHNKPKTNNNQPTQTKNNTNKKPKNKNRQTKKNQFILEADTIILWVETLIKNTVILHNDVPYNQIIGIPMGTNCAVNLANFFLFTNELAYLTTCLETKNYKRITDLRFTKRYLDDIPTFNNPDYETYKYDIYPKEMLELNLEGNNLPLACLDIHFYYNEQFDCYATTLHSKQDDPKFKGLPFTRYPHPLSFINPAYLYNTFTTELHRYYRNNTFFHTFALNTATLLDYLLRKQYNKNKLHRKLRHFISTHLPFYQTYNAHKATNYILQPLHVQQRKILANKKRYDLKRTKSESKTNDN
jgi:hypothetical protein